VDDDLFAGDPGDGCSPKAKKERYLQQANQYFDAGKYDEAEIEYIKVLRMEHENLEATDRLGIIYFEQGRFQRAFPFLARGGESGDTNLEARLALGRLYLAAGKLKEAGGAAGFVLDRRGRTTGTRRSCWRRQLSHPKKSRPHASDCRN